jgi:hypothetical protein
LRVLVTEHLAIAGLNVSLGACDISCGEGLAIYFCQIAIWIGAAVKDVDAHTGYRKAYCDNKKYDRDELLFAVDKLKHLFSCAKKPSRVIFGMWI